LWSINHDGIDNAEIPRKSAPDLNQERQVATENLLQLTAEVVAAHVSNNDVPRSELPALIQNVFTALSEADQPVVPEPARQQPAVSVRASVKPDYLVCLEDGKRLTMLKRYLSTNYNMSPQDYRAKWGLPADYPMVAPNYTEKRRTLAMSIGLGKKATPKAAKRVVRKTIEAVEENVTEPVAQAAKTGRKRLGVAFAKVAAAVHLGGAKGKAKPRAG
jgi:predicted transcriptional regulator